MQSLVIMPLSWKSNRNRSDESTQVAQLPHVEGHCSLTPCSLHLEIVAFVATQSQPRDIVVPSDFVTRKRNGESSHELPPLVGGVGAVGAVGVGAVGVGAVGAFLVVNKSPSLNKSLENVFRFGKTTSRSCKMTKR